MARVPLAPSSQLDADRISSGHRLGPAEVQARPGDREAYITWGAQDNLSAPYSLPGAFLQGIRPEAAALPEAPLIVFINARSGGRSGPELAQALSRALGRAQVFDLSQFQPDKVLTQLWDNFKVAINAGVPNAALYQSRLRIIVAGGDGTVSWVLATIKALRLHPQPPVAIMPLGTGNDLSRSFGWGAAFDKAGIVGYTNVYNTLLKVSMAKLEDLDCWNVRIHFPTASLKAALPHSVRVLSNPANPPPSPPEDASGQDSLPPVSLAGTVGQGPAVQAGGLFWNYVSIGLDARAAQNFHQLREEQPGCASNRLINQFWYTWFSMTSGWFYCPKGVSAKVKLEVQRPGSDDWMEVPLDSGIKALIVLNLQSYGGGRNLWGKHKAGDHGSTDGPMGHDVFTEPSGNDGRLEVVGLGHGLHASAVMITKGHPVHAKRICQASGVRMSLRAKHVRPDGQPSHAYLQIDGEPWMQPVPSAKDEHPIVVEISHQGVSKVLHNYTNISGDWFKPEAIQRPPPPGQELTKRRPSVLRPQALVAAMASMAGTVATEQGSELVQVGSERASSMHSGNSWAPQSTPGQVTRINS